MLGSCCGSVCYDLTIQMVEFVRRNCYCEEIEFFLCFLQMKEGKRLKEFLEDYDDDRDDPKYYR